MKQVSCIIGAGYSFVAGLPLAKDLFKTPPHVYSEGAGERIRAVYESYALWCESNPEQNPELYLSDLYTGNLSYIAGHVPFGWAVELISMVLATPAHGDPAAKYRSPRYNSRLTSPTYCNTHTKFWREIAAFTSNFSVITTNYDLLIERALRHRKIKGRFSIGFTYGGLPDPQALKGSPSRYFHETVHLKGGIPICKLHGSLNWARSSETISLFQDTRPAFRGNGVAAIVPPIREKQMPTWLKNVWYEAQDTLSKSSIWIVCGYSLPHYDIAIQQLFEKAGRNAQHLFIVDPFSEQLMSRWQSVVSNAFIRPLRGLPKGLDELREGLHGLQV